MGFDKVVHISIYFFYVLTLLFGVLYSKNNRKLTFKASLIVSIFGILYGGFMEILQHYIFINRNGNWYDFLANSIGVIIGALFFRLLKIDTVKKLIVKLSDSQIKNY